MFMRSPNNVLFYSTHCIFDEVLFPKCATPAKKSLTRLLDAPPTLSRTQTLITQISRLCQEIRDIKRQNKNRSNSTPKDEPREGATLTKIQERRTMDSNQCQDRTNIDGTDGFGCTYSSHSTLPPHSERSHDTPSHHETSHPSLYSTPPQSNQGQPAA